MHFNKNSNHDKKGRSNPRSGFPYHITQKKGDHMSNNVIKLIGLMLSTTLLFAVGGTTNIQKAGSHVGQHYAEFGSTGEADALTGPIVLTTHFNRNFSRGTDDTLGYDAGWGGQFIQSPGDAMLMMYQMPADATIKGVNVPVYEWGTGLQQMTVSVHKLSYPSTTDGGTYSSAAVDGDGWIGGYDMAEDGSVSISGDTYTAGGTASICQDGANSVADGAQDPLDVNATSAEAPDGTPAAGLLWPEGFSSVSFGTEVLDYAVGGATENWVNLADHGNGEIDVLAGEWIGVMLAYTGTGGGDDEATGFFYAEGSGLAEPWAFMKFYAGCGGTSGNGGWHIRHWLIRYELAVELTGDRAPVIQDYTVLSTTLDEGDRAVEATVTDDNPSGEAAGVASVVLSYSTDDSIYTDVAMTDNGDDTFSGTIPGQSAGSEVWYNITATDVGGLTVSTVTQYYTIFLAASDYLFYYNTEDYASWIDYYYFANSDLYGQTDFWSGPYYGSASSDLLANYMGVVEVTGSGPANIDTTSIGAWLAEGDHGYVLSGDEWLGAQTGWTNMTYGAGQFIFDHLGIAADFNDINYMASGDQNGVSRLAPVAGDAISGEVHAFLGDSLALNYDPSYELGLSNWLDGVTVADGFTNSYTAFSGTIDTTGAPADDAVEYATGPYKTHANGSKTVFLGFDPLCTNTQGVNDAAPHLSGYHWIGTAPYGPLQASVVYALDPQVVGIDDNEVVANGFELKGNYPNPFNPSTKIAFNLDITSDVTVKVFSLLGEEVATIHNGMLNSGTNLVTWNGMDNAGHSVASGVYLYRVEVGTRALTGKMMFLK